MVLAFKLVQMGLVGRNDRQNFDAMLEVTGVGEDNETSSVFGTFDNLLVGLDAGARANLYIHNGGSLTAAGLSLAHEEGSIAYLTVEGIHSGGSRSRVTAGSESSGELCVIGFNGRAQLTVQNGGTAATGFLLVGPNGVVAGSGLIAADSSAIAGQVAPGIDIVPNLEPRQEGQAAAIAITHAITPGTLTFSGTVTLSNTAVITIDVTGKNSFDILEIKGDVTLGGKLVLNFSNGYAPRQGDTFAFLQSSEVSGQFATVAIAGLAPGFDFDVTPGAAGVQLIANNDGEATTEPNQLILPNPRRRLPGQAGRQ
jgi:hypothetical protein